MTVARDDSPPSAMATRLEEAALRLFDEQGYDETTTEEVAREAGTTQRTFFRHFASKADVVFGPTDAATDRFVNLLYSQPIELPVTEALVKAISEQDLSDPVGPNDVRRVRIVSTTPSLGDARRAYEARFEGIIADWIAQRCRRAADDFDVRVAAATLVAARRVVVEQWQAEDGRTPVSELAARAIRSVRPLVEHEHSDEEVLGTAREDL